MAESTDSPFSVQPCTFPAKSKCATGVVNGHLTQVMSVSFTDRILVTISQKGAVNHWVHVPMSKSITDSLNPGTFTTLMGDDENALLPRSELTATTILGGTRKDDEVVGHTLATTIASAILVKRPDEGRLLVLGVGLQEAKDLVDHGYEDLIGTILECL